MANDATVANRFREFRERKGLSEEEAAWQMSISLNCLWDIERCEGDLSACYSPAEVRRFCEVLGIRPHELFGLENKQPPISPEELVHLIHEQCSHRKMTLEQFEDVVGWRLSEYVDAPEKLLDGMSVDGLQWLCREIGIDWQRAIEN